MNFGGVNTLSRGSFHQAIGGRGFTLVEVMVALTILSLVMMATVTGLRTLANTQTAIERATHRVDEIRRWQERPASGVLEDWGGTPARVMIEHLEEFSLATRAEYGEDWSGRKSEGQLSVPALVRLQMKAAGRDWPDLVLQVQR